MCVRLWQNRGERAALEVSVREETMTRLIGLIVGGVAMLAMAGPAPAASGKLVLYTSQPNADAQQTVDAFRTKHPDVEVAWIRDGTTKVMAKLRAEIAGGDPKPDLLFIADAVTMEGLKREGRLMAYAAAPVAGYDGKLYDRDKTYFGTKLITTGIVYNTRAPMSPASWRDLIKPEAKGLVAMPSPLTSGAALIHLATLTTDPTLGWDYYQALAGNGVNPKGGNGATFKAVAGGEKLYGMVVDFLAIREKRKGSPVDFVYPQEGVSAITEPVAILSTARNPEAAKAFIDFLLSREGQELAARQGYLPAHPEVAPPPGYPRQSDITIMPLDAGRALAEAEAHKKKFADIFAQ
jgi:iron(III) transport system substrate-binding protein